MESSTQAFVRLGQSGDQAPKLSETYLDAIAWVESLAANQSGADKTWVEDAMRSSLDHLERAVRVR